MTTDAQERALAEIFSQPHYTRFDVRPLADGSLEAWAFDRQGVLVLIFTVFADGNYASRAAWRVTRDRRIGVGPFD